MQSLAKEVKQELTGRIVPFWEGLRAVSYTHLTLPTNSLV